jgi:hypothetical protein
MQTLLHVLLTLTARGSYNVFATTGIDTLTKKYLEQALEANDIRLFNGTFIHVRVQGWHTS